MNLASEGLRRFGYLFYSLNPGKHYYENTSDVRDFNKEIFPVFAITIILEQVARFIQKKPILRYNDTITNVSHGLLMDMAKIAFRGAEVWTYAWIYNNYRLITLPWDSLWTWIICWVATDFCYYTMHRAFHQINILWAFHVVHHTPEDMMLSSPMRNNIFLIYVHWFTYFPMAFAIPPTQFLVHYHIGILYQYWLHTETIGKLPAFIEYIFTTPRHHRSHHGRNRRYIDKNFGGYLIIWDRIFGTFEEYNEDDKPLYGTVKQTQSFNPLVIQTSHFMTMWKNFCEYKTLNHKLSVIFKGPGWAPGKPWNGNIEDVPEPVENYPKYDPQLPLWCKAYVITHAVVSLGSYFLFHIAAQTISKQNVYVLLIYFIFTTISFGFILDNSSYALSVEFLRCISFFMLDKILSPELQLYGVYAALILQLNRILFSMSTAWWISMISYEQLLRNQKTL